MEFLWSNYGVRLPTDGLITQDRIIKEKPDQVKAFVRASLNGNAWAIEHPKEAVEIFLKFLPDASRAMTKAFWNLSSRFQFGGTSRSTAWGTWTARSWCTPATPSPRPTK